MKLFPLISTLFLSALFLGQAFAGQPVSTGLWSNTAIGGHDATAYYETVNEGHSPITKGLSRYTVVWEGAEWHFASQSSANKFADSPTSYIPKYNGYCANALSLGEGLINTDGSVWEFFGDQLYLFYAEPGRQRWLRGDWKTFQSQANKAWAQEISSALN
ncbi:hypothetical protein O1D97_16485 [Marinomonas sp. 15G1-11]|uniref:YHS domain-containing protein n=1 Tax=Marinomonas phaeophyticola TaxID=3004091 RepID=A0ABT4JY68_9GAMM|nr:YHS domain-containing (seleno)protein [Marinomonas sp. 15G1-11]MCZ2723165.1 hypothetical protein [Marinomonas sp. 15G1-11]